MSTGNAAARRPVRPLEKSSFAQTCNLLSQYLKDKRSLGIGIGITPTMIEPKDELPTTMNLLTNIDVKGSSGEAVEPPSAVPMTIFYGGQVLVFNDLPSERAEEIMAMAGKGMIPCSRSAVSDKETETVAAKQQPPTKFFNDMAIAGRASLHRFFEKRKDRIAASAPYQLNSRNRPSSNHFDLNL